MIWGARQSASAAPFERRDAAGDRIDVIVIGANPFEASVPLGDWQLARAFARRGHRVLFVNPIRGVAGRGKVRKLELRHRVLSQSGPITTITPLGVYGRLRGLPALAQERVVTAQVRAVARQLGMRTPMVLTVRPERGTWAGLSSGPLVYWQKDAEWTTTSAKHPGWMRWSYRRLLRAADVVVTVSRRLHDVAHSNGADAFIIPNGCDPSALQSDDEEPTRLQAIPRPRAVYAGRFNSRVDRNAYELLVRTYPKVSFIVVGEVDVELPAAQNLHALGPVGFEQLGAYLRHADVGLVPYAANEFNEASRPLKIYDYLAVGMPVLAMGVDTYDLEPNVVVTATSAEDAVSKLGPLIERAPSLRQTALDEARRNSWESRVDAVVSLAYAGRGTLH